MTSGERRVPPPRLHGDVVSGIDSLRRDHGGRLPSRAEEVEDGAVDLVGPLEWGQVADAGQEEGASAGDLGGEELPLRERHQRIDIAVDHQRRRHDLAEARPHVVGDERAVLADVPLGGEAVPARPLDHFREPRGE